MDHEGYRESDSEWTDGSHDSAADPFEKEDAYTPFWTFLVALFYPPILISWRWYLFWVLIDAIMWAAILLIVLAVILLA